jgi:hypothetical protein
MCSADPFGLGRGASWGDAASTAWLPLRPRVRKASRRLVRGWGVGARTEGMSLGHGAGPPESNRIGPIQATQYHFSSVFGASPIPAVLQAFRKWRSTTNDYSRYPRRRSCSNISPRSSCSGGASVFERAACIRSMAKRNGAWSPGSDRRPVSRPSQSNS